MLAALAPAFLLLTAGFWLATGESRRIALAQEAGTLDQVTLQKTVVFAAPNLDPEIACQSSADTTIAVVAGASVHYCYTITNHSGGPITLLSLLDDNGTVVVGWSPGFVLPDGQTLTPTLANGLIRTVSVMTTTVSQALWTVEKDGRAYQVTSQPTTIRIVNPRASTTLTVGAPAATCSTATAYTAALASNAYGQAAHCLTIRNQGDISFTQHLVSIPALGIIEAPLTPPSPTGPNQTLVITYASSLAAWANQLLQTVDVASITVRAFVTSTAPNGVAASSSAAVTVNGPSATIQVKRNVMDRPDQCVDDSTTSGPPGKVVYYCIVIRNTSVLTESLQLVPLTVHELADGATGSRVTITDVPVYGGGRITITNQFLAERGLPQILGPVRYPQAGVFSTNVSVTSSNPERGFRATATSNNTVVTIPTPRPPTPTSTSTPLPTWTPSPTWTPVPIPPTWTPVPTWTPAPTWTPSPTVLIFSTPGGVPPTPYPPIGSGGLATPTPDFFAPPGFLDPFAQTATAQALFGFPPADPFAQTATAQALFGFPPVDPFAQTATAQALFGFPPADPFAQTATAQALSGLESPLTTPQPTFDQTVPPLPQGVITVTATPEPTFTLDPALRPIQPPTPPASDAVGLFRSVLNGTVTAFVVLSVFGGVALFLLLAGMLAGISVGNPGPPKYQLLKRAVSEDETLHPSSPPSSTTSSAPSSTPQDDEDWPASLP
ncbi:hypothetical protein [Caldilinea sp.]|uniref:hypothetical protein n=1 Tax=Caldilinea sp. TaxID=2293560 RepID=UPI001B2B86C1|nr:hypothetical protein [Caldilinea sp.]MBO9392444.1 hypothetical protein [Caldilinea sp.]